MEQVLFCPRCSGLPLGHLTRNWVLCLLELGGDLQEGEVISMGCRGIYSFVVVLFLFFVVLACIASGKKQGWAPTVYFLRVTDPKARWVFFGLLFVCLFGMNKRSPIY